MSLGKRLVVPFIVIAALSVGACATTQVDRKQATEQKARDVSGDVWATNNQIDATMMALNNMMSADGPQLQQAFDRYAAEVDRLKKQSEVISKDGAFMRTEGDAYLSAWQKQNNDIQNQDLRDNSEQGRKTVKDRTQSVQGSYDTARTSLDRLLRNLEDVRTALRNDLTSRGVTGVSQTNVVQRSQQNAEEAKNNLRQVQSDSASLAEALSPSAPPVATTDTASDGTNQYH
ncbi:MAG: DUF2959 family protein [Betaproteobacteria bacterium]